MLRKKLGVGWGGDDHVPCTCTHGRCYATSCFLHLHTWLVLRNIMFLALAHMVGATQHHGVGWGWGGVGMITFLALARMVGATQHHVPCTCTHGWCYATSCFLHLRAWSVHTWCTLRCHKMKCMSGLVSPTDAFKKPLWQLWLTCSKKKRLTVMLLGPQIHCK